MERRVMCCCCADFVEKQRLVFVVYRVVEVDVERQRLLRGKGMDPTPKWGDADAAGNPHLLGTPSAVVEHPECYAYTRRNP